MFFENNWRLQETQVLHVLCGEKENNYILIQILISHNNNAKTILIYQEVFYFMFFFFLIKAQYRFEAKHCGILLNLIPIMMFGTKKNTKKKKQHCLKWSYWQNWDKGEKLIEHDAKKLKKKKKDIYTDIYQVTKFMRAAVGRLISVKWQLSTRNVRNDTNRLLMALKV